MKECFGIIYKATNKINGKVYIGQTTQKFKKRVGQHLSHAKNGYDELVLYRAIRKYGKENFLWCIVEYCNSAEELRMKEAYYIDKYNSIREGYNLYFNVWCQAGKNNPHFGMKHTDEAKRIISTKAKDRLSDPKNHPWYGKKHTEESKRKMVISRKNRLPVFDETRKRMSEAQKRRDSSTRVLPKIKKGKDHPCFGKTWSKERKLKWSIVKNGVNNPFYGKRHTEDTRKKMRKNHVDVCSENNPMYGKIGTNSPNSKQYVITTPEGRYFVVHGLHNFCKNYKKTKLYSSSLCSCISGRRKHHKGYKCRYYSEETDFNLPHWEEEYIG